VTTPTEYDLAWSVGSWLNPPADVAEDGADLLVTTREGSDFWRTTGYGFVRDDGHALLVPFPAGSALEVGFVADFTELYDQAGALVRVDAETWIKAGVEVSDGEPHWAGREVTVRVSRAGDAVTVRARCADEPWRTIRLAWLRPDAVAQAGLFCCSPHRAALRVRFTRLATGPADASLH
jgi:regulation of enolase protein 1 (concanavalin A-like superfamily)